MSKNDVENKLPIYKLKTGKEIEKYSKSYNYI